MNYLESLLQTWTHAPFAKALGWSLIHFLWEGVAIALLLAALLFLCRRGSARLRYALACLALIAMPVALGLTFALSTPSRPATPLLPRVDLTDAGPIVTGQVSAPPSGGSLKAVLPWVPPLWMAGVLIFYLRSLGGWMVARRLRSAGVYATGEWRARLDSLRERLKLSKPVVLLESCQVDVPVVMGFLRPVILMPMGLLAGLSTDQLESILIHELAHIRRWDYVVNLLQNLVEGLLFYHPAVWWVSGQIRAERENCCDDVVVNLKGDARGYAAALATLEQNRWPASELALAATGGSLMKRIRRLLQEPEGHRASAAPGLVVGLLVVSLGVAVASWQTTPSSAPKPAPSQTLEFQILESHPLPSGFAYAGKVGEEDKAQLARLAANPEAAAAPQASDARHNGLPQEQEMAYSARVAANQQSRKPVTLVAQAAPVEDQSSPATPQAAMQERQQKLRDQSQAVSGVTGPYKKWMNEDVAYIITDEERAAYKKLTTDEEWEKFIEQFWLRRDPTPGTPENEYRDEHYRRIAYTNEHYSTSQGLPGWKTDRGRIYIVYGPPDEIESHPSGGNYQRPAEQGGGTTTTVPFEQWRYRFIEGVGTNVIIEFVDPTKSGEYRMTSDPNEKNSDYIEGYMTGVKGAAAQLGVHEPKAGATVQVMSTATAAGGKAVLVSVPLNAFGGRLVNVMATITTATRRPVQAFEQTVPGPAPMYSHFVTLGAGSYVLKVLVRDPSNGAIATDEITFEVK